MLVQLQLLLLCKRWTIILAINVAARLTEEQHAHNMLVVRPIVVFAVRGSTTVSTRPSSTIQVDCGNHVHMFVES